MSTRLEQCVAIVASVGLALPTLSGAPGEWVTPEWPLPAQRNWTLVWSDEFDGPSLDARWWTSEDAPLVKNDELQYYAPDALSFREGLLVISASKRERAGRPYTSGLIETRGKFFQAYGRFEVRAKVPAGRGLWPAFWTLPNDDTWPPEIDVLETLGHQPRRVYTHWHWGTLPDKGHGGAGHELGPDFSQGFHTYRVDWLPDRLDFFVDDRLVLSGFTHVPASPHYLILNLAVGGHWPGNPDGATRFPAEFEVDWVRAYALDHPEYAFVSVLGSGGSVRIEPDRWCFKRGERVRLIPEPGFGQRFIGWEGDQSGGDKPLEFTINKNTRLTAKFEVDSSGERLLSRGAKVTASSDEGGWLTPDWAIDGRYATRWSSLFTDPQWLAIDLGERRRITGIKLQWHAAFASHYRVQVSDDGEAWRDVLVKTDGRGGTERLRGLDATGRHVRILGEKRGGPWGYSIWEFEVWGTDAR